MINTLITVHVHPDDLEEIARDLRRQMEEATLGQEVPWRTLARSGHLTIRASVDQDAWHRRKRETDVRCAHPETCGSDEARCVSPEKCDRSSGT